MRKLKQSRAASFMVIAAVYNIAAAIGIAVYNTLTLPWWLSLLVADAVATAVTFLY